MHSGAVAAPLNGTAFIGPEFGNAEIREIYYDSKCLHYQIKCLLISCAMAPFGVIIHRDVRIGYDYSVHCTALLGLITINDPVSYTHLTLPTKA